MFWRRRQVRIHLKEDAPSVEGVLVERPNGFYRLEAAKAMSEASEHISLEGVVWIPRENVLFWQEVQA